eukprot:GHVP01015829.1.p1 GENE.GHVP01015829.1~~GHVP01015829.1.p1  ORF type:complete len:129 (-),score=23.33 GHVP01015829.1:45-401(-)
MAKIFHSFEPKEKTRSQLQNDFLTATAGSICLSGAVYMLWRELFGVNAHSPAYPVDKAKRDRQFLHDSFCLERMFGWETGKEFDEAFLKFWQKRSKKIKLAVTQNLKPSYSFFRFTRS